MKKNYILIAMLFAFIGLSNIANAQVNLNYEAIIKQVLNTQYQSKSINAEVPQKLKLNWNTTNAAWDTTNLEVYTYDANSNRVLTMNSDYTSSHWVNNQKVIGFFTTPNILDSNHFYMWSAATSSYTLSLRYLYTWTSFNQISAFHLMYFASGTWIPYITMLFHYDGANHIAGTRVDIMGAPSDSSTYTVDANGNPATQNTYKYKTGIWKNSEYHTFIYAGSNKTQEITQQWDTLSSAFVNHDKKTWTYNAASKETNNTYQLWSGGVFADYSKIDTYYDANGNLTYDLSQDFGTTWVNNEKNIYNANVVIGVSELAKNIKLSAYPNPTTGVISFSTSISSVEVYNAIGKKVIQQQNTSEIDLSSYTKGIYFVKINTGKTTYTQKIIVQ